MIFKWIIYYSDGIYRSPERTIKMCNRGQVVCKFSHVSDVTSSFLRLQVDKDFIPGLMYIRDNEAPAEEFEAMTLPFTVPNASGQDIQLSSKYSHITLENRAEYVRLAINYR